MYQNNPRFRHWSPQFRPRGQFLRRNYTPNHFRYTGPQVQNNYEFWCETCDKGFQTLNILENHKSQHQKCNIDGCQFVAHPKIITKHIQMQHSTGLYKKISKLNNPEEIRKWREERKLKYPTKKNIEKKAAELKEKIERGEKMGMNYQKHHKHRKPELYSRNQHNHAMTKGREKFQGRHKNNKFKNETASFHKKPQAAKKVCRTIPKPDNTQKLNPFAGIQHIIIEDNHDEEIDESLQNSLIEDDDVYAEEGINNVNEKSQLEPSVCGALSSLMNEYGSSDEDVSTAVDKSINGLVKHQVELTKTTTEIKKETIEKKLPITADVNNKCKSDEDSGPEETVITKSTTDHNVEENSSNNLKPKLEKRPRSPPNIKHYKRPKYLLPSTLLVKLLSREIEQERNIILQCVRHTVKNNYFDNTKD
ncbi:PREDICTED: nuclear fragile X mental retardation-interacting protein 1 [Papilio xuthus]|uniref:Nuclear fragile X mental retardation-interacting protein 1 n=1 Tax=Papilio xuthus TaxID=66420 RepID=A0AAJ6ZXK0_PAPXU|nr:PREDICTED: nuclear fragile X mental retardation-interacting protein 1 [Papilio xuthus]